MSVGLTRRTLLGTAAGAATLGAGVILAPRRVAADSSFVRPRLVVIVARGGMDGLAFSPPASDPDYIALRRSLATGGEASHRIDGDFALHPRLVTLGRLAGAGRVRIAPATALWTPDRSHFRAQDLLETGTASLTEESGWLRRAADLLFPGGVSAVGIGPAPPLMLQGKTPTQNWSADVAPVGGFLQGPLAALYQGDPLQGAVANLGRLSDIASGAAADDPAMSDPVVRTARAAAQFLAAEHGASVAVLSVYGFDTHVAQGGVDGRLAATFASLDRTIAELQTGLGLAWSMTTVLVVTEFGRTALVNGVGGTDHGTAFTATLTGGAVRPGGLLGDWPGLAPAALFEGRDVRPALDLRAMLKGVLMEQFGLDRATLATRVFPGSADVKPLQGLVHPISSPWGFAQA